MNKQQAKDTCSCWTSFDFRTGKMQNRVEIWNETREKGTNRKIQSAGELISFLIFLCISSQPIQYSFLLYLKLSTLSNIANEFSKKKNTRTVYQNVVQILSSCKAQPCNHSGRWIARCKGGKVEPSSNRTIWSLQLGLHLPLPFADCMNLVYYPLSSVTSQAKSN